MNSFPFAERRISIFRLKLVVASVLSFGLELGTFAFDLVIFNIIIGKKLATDDEVPGTKKAWKVTQEKRHEMPSGSGTARPDVMKAKKN